MPLNLKVGGARPLSQRVPKSPRVRTVNDQMCGRFLLLLTEGTTFSMIDSPELKLDFRENALPEPQPQPRFSGFISHHCS